jgi:isocitrate dehydrogenase
MLTTVKPARRSRHAVATVVDSAVQARVPIVAAPGDGIGPEIMSAVLRIVEAAGARLDVRNIEVGEKVYRQGVSSGIDPAAWAALRERRVLLKGPITTPQGGGYKSLNVTLRKTLGLYANVRPCVAYSPFVPTLHPAMDVVIVRENEEDLYAGIEHRQTDDVYQCLKLISRQGCERIVRYAFEFAKANGRRKVSCFTKDNIMKMTDGLFHKVFTQIATEYPGIAADHKIVDIGAARLATRPQDFDVIVLPNLYGDILSDVAAEMTGSVGLAGSANIGDYGARFEAIHGSAPDIAGQDKANPSGLLLAAVMMLHHIGQHEAADRAHAAWLRTIEDGLCTPDIADSGKTVVGTARFAKEVIARLDQNAKVLKLHSLVLPAPQPARQPALRPAAEKEIVGVDVFLHVRSGNAETMAARLRKLDLDGFNLLMITNRGIKVWPNGAPETFCVDHWRCRFMIGNSRDRTDHASIVAMLGKIAAAGFDFIKVENLYTFDGEAGYSLGQGQ